MEVVSSSLERSFVAMLVQPETRRIIGLLPTGSMAERNTPRVQKTASTYDKSGLIVSPGLSRPRVGPRK